MNRWMAIAGSTVGILAVATVAWVATRRTEPRVAVQRPSSKPTPIPKTSASLAEFAAREEKSPKVERRAAASRARITLAYASAKRGAWGEARRGFERAAKVSKDVPGMDPGFGTLSDQAFYQALVCLSHERPKEEAIEAFRSFIKERPESPLVYAAHRRLGKLRGGTADANDDSLLQSAVAKQEAKIRFETSVCGPKAISELLKRTKREDPGYKAIAKLCGTTDAGTTLAGMRQGLKSLGIATTGVELNRIDFARAPLPLLVLEQDHYVLVVQRTDDAMQLYDPRFGTEIRRRLPAFDDREFRIVALTTELPPVEYNAGTPPKASPEFPKTRSMPKPRIVDIPSTKTSKTGTAR